MRHFLHLAVAPGFVAAAVFGLAACDGSTSTQQAKSEAASGVNKTAEGLGNIVEAAGKDVKVAADKAKPKLEEAADRAKPAAEHAAADVKSGLKKLAVAGGKVMDKTGDVVAKAGENAKAQADKTEAKNPPAQ